MMELKFEVQMECNHIYLTIRKDGSQFSWRRQE